ncbi:hypothetical protein K9K77_02135 [Candidatus Babeliales bacterium]|nr:hypothetical protein [Candidatus Babeliales bacterium]
MKKIAFLLIVSFSNTSLYSIDRVDIRSAHFLTSLRTTDDDTSKDNLFNSQEKDIAQHLSDIQKKQGDAINLTINIDEETTLIKLFSIQDNLKEAQKEHKRVLKHYLKEKSELKNLSPHFETYEKELFAKIDLFHDKIEDELNRTNDFITARYLALNSNYSVEEAIEAMNFIKKTKEHFKEHVVRKIDKDSTPLLNYHYDVFYENFSQVKDARDRFAQRIKDNYTFVASKIKEITNELVKKYGKNKRLQDILQEKLSNSLSEIAKITASLQIILERLEERVKHEAAEQV